MTQYTDVFGGANIYPSEINYSALTLTADVTLSWPEETSASTDLATRIMDLSAAIGGWSVILPAANKTAPGQTLLLNNVGVGAILIKDAAGVQVVSIAAGETWQIYLTDNTTAAGVWDSFQFGASVSQANASALAGTGIVAVGTQLSQSMPVVTFSADYAAGNTDRAKMFVWDGAAGTLTLPSAPSVGDNWFINVHNAGTGALVVDPAGSPLIDGASTLSFQPGESAAISTDGLNYYTVGFGQSATFAFDYTVINIAGTGNYTLTGTELNRIAYKFTGVLTGNRVVIVPTTVQQYWVDNETTGSFTLTIKTAAGTGQLLPQSERVIYYCDGTNVVDADSSTAGYPISIANGGTGAITASAARINLGAGAVGDALYTSSTQANAWTALGNSPLISGGVF